MSDTVVTFIVFIGFFSGGDEVKALRPVNTEIVEGKFGGAPVVRVPTFPSADVENAVTRIGDDITAIVDGDGEGVTRRGDLRKKMQRVSSPRSWSCCSVKPSFWKKIRGVPSASEIFSTLSARANEIKRICSEPVTARKSTVVRPSRELSGRMVCRRGSGWGEKESAEDGCQKRIGRPDVVVNKIACAAGLAKHEIFVS